MEFRQLRYFIAVADTGSFSKAAQNLYVTQPALSQQITKLEYDLGVTLLERNTRSVRLTAAGQDLYQRAIPFLRDMENMVQAVRTTKERGFVSQTINIGFEDGMFSLSNTSVFSYIGHMRKAHPDMQLNFMPMIVENAGRLLQEGVVDLCFCIHSSTIRLSPNVDEQIIQRGRLALAVPKGWNVDFGTKEFYEAIDSINFYFPDLRAHWHGIVTELLGEHNCHPRYATVTNYTTAINYVAAGAGVFFAPEIQLLTGPLQYYDVIPFPNKTAEYRVVAMYQKNNNGYLLKHFLDDLPEYVDISSGVDEELLEVLQNS